MEEIKAYVMDKIQNCDNLDLLKLIKGIIDRLF